MPMNNIVADCLDTNEVIPQLAKGGIMVPSSLDLRDKVLPTENQGTTPHCVAYTCTSWAENILWMKTGTPKNLDADKVYKYAKTIDGYPDTDGTTLDAALKAMIHLKMIDASKTDVKLFNLVIDLKRAIHKYGPTPICMRISTTWNKHYGKLVMDTTTGDNLGGHAVIACGYNRTGVYIQNSWSKDWGKYGFALITWDVFNAQFVYGAVVKDCLNDMGF